ncbi:MAG TPA: SRPBCC domain-containing protein [Acidimicrobiales bacterium]
MTADETLETVGGRNVLRVRRRLSHPPAKVWRALTEPGELTHWFPADVEVVESDVDPGLAPGATLRFVFREGEGETQEGRVVEADPPHVLAYTWGDATLRWELRPHDGGAACELVFTHAFDDRPGAAAFAAGWGRCLVGLAQRLAGEPVRLPDDHVERHEALVARFGLDEGRLADGPAVHFVRQLPWPLGRVWDVLTDDATAEAVRGGRVVAADPPHRLAVDADGGVATWELSEGPGGGRVTLTQPVPADRADAQVAALVAWHARLAHLADAVAGRPATAVDEPALRDRYAKLVADTA